jgi:hypothetical protein
MKKILALIIAITINLNAVVSGSDTKLATPLENFFSTLELDYFIKEFKLSMQIGFCGKGLDKAIGIKAHLIEPVGFFETSKKPLFFPTLNLDLEGNILKSGHSRASITSEGGRDEFNWSHYLHIPIMGMIFKKKIPIFCFSEGKVQLPLIQEFLPTYNKDYLYKNLFPQMAMMVSPQGLVSQALDCMAAEGSNAIVNGLKFDLPKKLNMFSGDDNDQETEKANDRPLKSRIESAVSDSSQKIESTEDWKSKGLEYLTFVRNTMYYSVGCLGYAPVGGYIPAQDPAADSELLFFGAINTLHGASAVLEKPFFYKQTTFKMNTGGTLNNMAIPNTMCRPKKFLVGLESQYALQRVYPTAANVHEVGATPMHTAIAANVPGSKDNFVYSVWQRRDYYALAYFCPGD